MTWTPTMKRKMRMKTTEALCKDYDKCTGDCGPWCCSFESSMKDMKVSDLFMMQERLQKVMFDFDLPVDSVEDFKYSVLALIGELGEVLEADKRWKNVRNGKYDREGKLDELVDCMAFMVNMVLFSGFTAEEFNRAFATKNNRNFERFYKEKESKQSETGPLHLEGPVV